LGKSLHIAAYPGGNASTAGTTPQYWPYIGGISTSTTEANANQTVYSAGTLSMFTVNLSANLVAAVSTFRIRKNSANGNQVVTTLSATSGQYKDTSNTDAVVANDIVDVSFVAGSGTNTVTVASITTLFDATTDTVTKLSYNHATLNNSAYNGNGTTSYVPIHGYMPPSGNSIITTEADGQAVVGNAGTFRNMSMNLTTNARAVVDTLRFRKNGANGNQVVSTTASTSGIYRDSSNTDTVAAADKVNYALTNGAAATTKTVAYFACEFVSTATSPAISFYSTAPVTSTLPTQAKATTNNYSIAGRDISNTAEAQTQIKLPDAFTFAYLAIIVNANPITAASTLRFRKNGANGNLVVSITASTAGTFTDTTHSDSCVADNLVNLQLVTGANATAVNITHTSMSVMGQFTSPFITMTPNLLTLTNKFITKI
jgi:hypothetical protein